MKALCDPEYLEDELDNIKEVFEENGYDRKEIERAMKEKDKTAEDEENEETRGMVVIQNIPNFTPQYSTKTWIQSRERNRKESEGSDSKSKDPIRRQKQLLHG